LAIRVFERLLRQPPSAIRVFERRLRQPPLAMRVFERLPLWWRPSE
jgi:hypothetical protein